MESSFILSRPIIYKSQEMFKRFFTNWKKKHWFSKFTDFFFIALLITLVFPQGRMAVGGFINRMKSMITQPDLMSRRVDLPESTFIWPMTDAQGQPFDFSTVKGKVVFLNLWATWCPPCVGEMPGIQELYEAFKDHPEMAFVLVSNESPEVISRFMDKKKYTFPVYSARSAAPVAFATNSIPTSYVLSKKGQIVVKEVGAVNWGGDRMESIILDLLEEQADSPTE